MIRNSETLQVVGHNLRAREQVLDRTDLKRVWGGNSDPNTSTNTGGLRESDHTENTIVLGQPGNDLDMQKNLNDNWNKPSGGRGGGGGLFGMIREIFSSPPVLLPPICPPEPEPPPETTTKKKKKDEETSPSN